MNLDTKLKIPTHVMSRLVGDETVLLNLETGLYFGLDGVGQVIWESVSAGENLGSAVATIVASFDVEQDQAAADVLAFAGTLVERGLLSE